MSDTERVMLVLLLKSFLYWLTEYLDVTSEIKKNAVPLQAWSGPESSGS